MSEINDGLLNNYVNNREQALKDADEIEKAILPLLFACCDAQVAQTEALGQAEQVAERARLSIVQLRGEARGYARALTAHRAKAAPANAKTPPVVDPQPAPMVAVPRSLRHRQGG